MTIEIELDGRRRHVRLRREGAQWIAGLDGREIALSVVEVAGRLSMLVGPPAAFARSELRRAKEGGSHGVRDSLGTKDSVASGFSRKSYEIAFEARSGGELIVHVNGVAVPLTVVNPRQRGRERRGEAGAETQPRAIVAPMPGRIVKVLVQPGEAVQARQGLVVVEAMKMENELRAPRGGTVVEVRAREGALVEANAVLVVLR